jgi:pyruvate,water dikinase
MGFSISSSCFARFLNDLQRDDELARLESSLDLEEMLRIVAELEQCAMDCEVPDDIGKSVWKALTHLQERIGRDRKHFAVRSSATVEDSVRISFAGQAKSYLGVSNIDDVLDAIRRTWLSLLSPGVVMYLRGSGIPLNRVRMGVIVQEMMYADVSGVMFTANPADGNPNQIMVESTWGLGEALVSGKTTPDSYVVDKHPLRIAQRGLGPKEMMCVLDTDKRGSTTFRVTPKEKRDILTLSDDDLLRIADTGLKIERGLGAPQDIEWCIERERLIILQARPITTLAGEP